MMSTLMSKMKEKWQLPAVAGQGTIWMLLLTGCILTASLVNSEAISGAYLPTLGCLINSVALAGGGFVAGRKAGKNGWYHGLLQGAIYSMTLFLVSFLAFDAGLSNYFLLFMASACGLTTLSGMVGVNTAK